MPGKTSDHRADDELQRAKNMRPGRIVLVLVFLTIGVLNAFTLHTSPPDAKDDVIGWILISEAWITASLGAIWFRKKWGRFVAAGICFLSAVFAAALAPHLLGQTPLFIPISVVVYLGVTAILGYHPAIRLLTRRRY